MSKTSSEVKRRYNEKTYSCWRADIRKEDFEKIEEMREGLGLSRSRFLEMLVEFYNDNH